MYMATLDLVARGGSHGPRFLFPLLLLLLVFGLGTWLIGKRRGKHGPSGSPGSPMDTLQNRFARGDIDRSEFEHRKAVLLGEDDIPPAPARPQPPVAPEPPMASEPPAAPEPPADEDDE